MINAIPLVFIMWIVVSFGIGFLLGVYVCFRIVKKRLSEFDEPYIKSLMETVSKSVDDGKH